MTLDGLPQDLGEAIASVELPPSAFSSRDLIVVTPTHSSPAVTAYAVQQLFALNASTPFHILIIDNGGADHAELRLSLREFASRIGWIVTTRNTGCSGAMAIGQAAAMATSSKFICLSDNDAVCTSQGLLALLLSQLDAWDLVCPMHPHYSGSAPGPVPARYGLPFHFLTMRREVIEKIGFVDHRFFYSMDDHDFVFRARGAGFRAAAVPGGSYRHPPFRPRLFARDTVYRTARNLLRIADRHGTISLDDRMRAWLHLLLYSGVKLMRAALECDPGMTATLATAWADGFAGAEKTRNMPDLHIYRPTEDRPPRAADGSAWLWRVIPRRYYKSEDPMGRTVYWKKCAATEHQPTP